MEDVRRHQLSTHKLSVEVTFEDDSTAGNTDIPVVQELQQEQNLSLLQWTLWQRQLPSPWLQ